MKSVQALSLPDGPCILASVTIPAALCEPGVLPVDALGMVRADLGLAGGKITKPQAEWPRVDANDWMALPPFVDAHVHLDKAFTAPRSGLGDGTLLGAIRVMVDDMAHWTRDDLQSRMRRGAETALSQGTGLMRTHLDTALLPDDTESWDVLADIQANMAGALTIQPVSLTALERAGQADFEQRCKQIARRNGILGAFIPPGPVPVDMLRRFLTAADGHDLDVDFHVDENLVHGPSAIAAIAEIMMETGHQSRVVAGHCCNLSLLEGDDLDSVLGRVAQAGIHIIALPLTNLFLQDRNGANSPRRRGIAPLREMQAHGIPVATASDNVQDAFYPFGNFDMLEVLRTMITAGHLEQDMDRAMLLGFDGGAQAMGCPPPRIALGGPADFSLFRATNWLGVLAQPQSDRMVLRNGKPVQQTITHKGAA